MSNQWVTGVFPTRNITFRDPALAALFELSPALAGDIERCRSLHAYAVGLRILAERVEELRDCPPQERKSRITLLSVFLNYTARQLEELP